MFRQDTVRPEYQTTTTSHTYVPTRNCSSAQLITTNKNGLKDVIGLAINKPVTIGRNPVLCSYVIPELFVSNEHCKISVVPSSHSGVIVSCQDLSLNGIFLNGQKICKTSIILMDGDVLQIPSSQTFTCQHTVKEKKDKETMFDPTPPENPMHKRIGNYTVTSHCLGSGSFATVNLAIDTVAQRQVACKTIKMRKEGEIKKVMKEVNILRGLHHPNINKIYSTEIRDKFLNIFIELCTGGDLFTYISTQGSLIEGEARYIMFQLFKGLTYLHNKHISHRDLKPENILLSCPGSYPRIQIADFGLARPKAHEMTLNVCGTVSYLPPEGILALDNKHLGYVGMPSDCWAAGIILFVMLAGRHPFDRDPFFDTSNTYSNANSQSECYSYDEDLNNLSQASARSEIRVKKRIVNGEMMFHQDIWDNLPEARELVRILLIDDHQRRATVRHALASKFITCEREEMEKAYQERIMRDWEPSRAQACD